MVIDTSAPVAILHNEPEATRLEMALVSDRIRLIPATCVLEARMVLVSRRGEHALAEFHLWLGKIEADIMSVDADLVDLATQARLIYGQSRHAAALTFADCLSYASAKRASGALLFKGNAVAHEDIPAA